MKKENAKFVILKQQNLGKSHFCKQKRVPACALLYALWCVNSNVGFSSIKIDKLSQGCRTMGPEYVTAPVALCPGGQECTDFFMFC